MADTVDGLATLKAKWPHGPALWRELSESGGAGNKFLLSFSRGKDSLAVAIALQEAGYDLVPFYCERIPGISFIEESLDYYERALFGGRRIVRALHPATALQIKSYVYQPPHWLAVSEAASLAKFSYQDVQDAVAYRAGLPETTWTATGLRAADSQMRRKSIAINGPSSANKRTFGAIWDWNLDLVIGAIERRRIKLPADYALFGRTFDGLMGEFVAPLKRERPEDYAKVLELFPLVEAEVFRYERARQ